MSIVSWALCVHGLWIFTVTLEGRNDNLFNRSGNQASGGMNQVVWGVWLVRGKAEIKIGVVLLQGSFHNTMLFFDPQLEKKEPQKSYDRAFCLFGLSPFFSDLTSYVNQILPSRPNEMPSLMKPLIWLEAFRRLTLGQSLLCSLLHLHWTIGPCGAKQNKGSKRLGELTDEGSFSQSTTPMPFWGWKLPGRRGKVTSANG